MLFLSYEVKPYHWSRTKWTSSSSHWKLICSRNDIAEKLLNWRKITMSRSLLEESPYSRYQNL